tara:strand:- start:1911 stop:2378 length:468 start_codon:yes stop_codon:yes gene_type:complete
MGEILETFKNKGDCNRSMVRRGYYEKGLTIFLVFLALAFMGTGITGFFGLEPDAGSNYCTDDSHCAYSTCCSLYGKDYGVCAQDYECETVYEASKESDSVEVEYAPETEDLATENYVAVSLGVILLLIIAVVSYVEWHQVKPTKKRTKRKRRKKK